MKYCDCLDWAANIEKVNGPILLQSLRSGGRYQYDGTAFKYCPWCSYVLKEKAEPQSEVQP